MNLIFTPETDTAWMAYKMDSTCDEGDPWALAARLERRLTIARKALESIANEPLSQASIEKLAEETLELTKPQL